MKSPLDSSSLSFSSLILILSSFALNQSVFAKNKTILKAKEQVLFKYISAPWNSDSTAIDFAYLVLKDEASGKLAKILLEETAPDSAEFEGRFSIDFEKPGDFKPVIFIPPNELRDASSFSQFVEMIKNNQTNRKPIVSRLVQSQRVIEVYDTPDQARSALNIYKKEQFLIRLRKMNPEAINELLPSIQTLEVADRSKLTADEIQKIELSRERESERLRIEQIEGQKMIEVLKDRARLSKAQRKSRDREAEILCQAGTDAYQKADYALAKEKFESCLALNPEAKDGYLSFAVSLYRLKEYNRALAILNLIEPKGSAVDEKLYYKGLIYFRFEEYQVALQYFEKVKKKELSDLRASAAFYEGLIFMNQKKFERAKAAFEFVLDQSKDPEMDKKAEEFIEKIIAAQSYENQRQKRFFIMGMAGLMYDSNILLAPQNNITAQGEALDSGDARGLFIGDAEYRMLYTEKYEWSAKINTLYLHTNDTQLSRADPWVTNISSPFHIKGKVKSKGYRWSIRPAFETIFMDPFLTGSKENIMNSSILINDFTLINSDRWFSTYTLELRSDASSLPNSVGDFNADAFRFGVRTSQSYFLNDTKKRAIVGTVGYLLNEAKGAEFLFRRIEAGSSFITPIGWSAIGNFGVHAFELNFPKSSNQRKDFNVTVSTGFQKPISDIFVWGVTATYAVNSSNSPINDYVKYTLLTSAIFNYSL